MVYDFDHDLDRSELGELVSAIAAQPQHWRPLVRRGAGQRTFAQVRRGRDVDIWVIAWPKGGDTGFDDHDLSRGAAGSSGAVVVGGGSVSGVRLRAWGRGR